MDEELRRLEHAARTSGDATAWLAFSSALRREGRSLEAAQAALEARSRGASPELVSAVARPPEGGGDLCAPWPHVRGDSAATGRSRVAGPGEGAGVLFRYRFEPGSRMPLSSSPLVLPDNSVVLLLELGEAAEGAVAVALDASGSRLWSADLPIGGPPGTLLATGELVVGADTALLRLDARSGRVLSRSPRPPSGRLDAVDESGERASPGRARERCAAWDGRVLVRQTVVEPGRVSDLRGPEGERLLTRAAPVATPDGWAYLLAQPYRLGPSGRGGQPPDLHVWPLEALAFAPTGEVRWRVPVAEPGARGRLPLLVAGAHRIHAIVESERCVLDRATGKVLFREPAPVPYFALDQSDEPVPLAPFGPPLASPPVVDSLGRRYAGTRRGTVVGLGPGGEPLFEVRVAEPATSPIAGGADGRLAIGPGRLWLVQGEELLSLGTG